MDRIANMKAFKEKQEREKADKRSEEQKMLDAGIEEVRSLKDRIEELLDTANHCKECGIEIDVYGVRHMNTFDSWEKGTFVTNGISHRVGFVTAASGSNVDYSYIGIRAGGACGKLDFITDGDTVASVHEDTKETSAPLQHHINRFLRDFDLFERMFYAYIDGIVGKDA